MRGRLLMLRRGMSGMPGVGCVRIASLGMGISLYVFPALLHYILYFTLYI